MTRSECIERLNTIMEHSVSTAGCEFAIKANDWRSSDGSKQRTYFSIVEKTTNYKITKHYSEKKYGYLDTITGEYKPEKYGDLTCDFTFGGSKF